MATDFTFINAALTRAGCNPITSLEQGDAEATVTAQNYEPLARAALSGHPWKFATKTAELTRITGTLPGPWLYAYQLPTDMIELRSVRVDGAPIAYEVMANKILCDYDEDNEVVAHYAWRVPESMWPGWFAEPLTRRLEALYLRAIKEDFTAAEARDAAADGRGQYVGQQDTFAAAKLIDAQQQPPRKPPYTYPILAARRA